jgi:hypothetical protein
MPASSAITRELLRWEPAGHDPRRRHRGRRVLERVSRLSPRHDSGGRAPAARPRWPPRGPGRKAHRPSRLVRAHSPPGTHRVASPSRPAAWPGSAFMSARASAGSRQGSRNARVAESSALSVRRVNGPGGRALSRPPRRPPW